MGMPDITHPGVKTFMEMIEAGEYQEPLCCELGGKTVYEYVVDEMDGDLEPDIRIEFTKHFRYCPICAGIYSRLQRILDVVGQAPEALADARPSNRFEATRGKKATSGLGVN